MTLLGLATLGLALVTAISAGFTAWMAIKTSDLAEENKKLIVQGEKQHRERLKPYCVPFTNNSETIVDFTAVVGERSNFQGGRPGVMISENAMAVWLNIKNQGLGPALNVRFHFDDIHGNRLSKDFLVAHILHPGEFSNFLSEIPRESFPAPEGGDQTFEPYDIVNNIYFVVCEYESIFGENYYSVVSKGYRDPALTNDGKNGWRLLRPRTPPVVFAEGIDPASAIWHVPNPSEPTPSTFLNLPPLVDKTPTLK